MESILLEYTSSDKHPALGLRPAGHRAQLRPVARATMGVYDSSLSPSHQPLAPSAGRCAMTGSLETVNAADLLGWLAGRDAELEFSAIYGHQHLELRVEGGSIRSVALGGQPLYDHATILGLGASLAAVRRGAFELRTPSDRNSTGRELGVAIVPWLLAAIGGDADISEGTVDPDEEPLALESHPLRLEPLALERQPLTPTLRAFLTLGGYVIRERLPSQAVAATLGIDAAWTRTRFGELVRLGVLERESPATQNAVRGVTGMFPARRR